MIAVGGKASWGGGAVGVGGVICFGGGAVRGANEDDGADSACTTGTAVGGDSVVKALVALQALRVLALMALTLQ